MELQNFLEEIIFSFGPFSITLGNIVGFGLSVFAVIFLQRISMQKLLPILLDNQDLDRPLRRKIFRLVNYVFLFGAISVGVITLNIDYEYREFKFSYIPQGILIWQLARLVDTLLSKILIPYLLKRNGNKESALSQTYKQRETISDRNLQYIVYVLAAMLFVNVFNLNYVLTNIQIGGGGEDGSQIGDVSVSVINILKAILIFLVARFLYWLSTKVFLDAFYSQRKINIGSQYAFNQLLSYVIYTIAILYILENLGFKLTVIWGGAAALLIGVGFGLQQTFNDLFSGILLLFERTVELGDVVELSNGLTGTVIKIGLRASFVQTFDNRTVIVPNSELVIKDVTNWGHKDEIARFYVSVGVAYGSDTAKVKEILYETASAHEKILTYPVPFVRFIDFGDSSLDFEIHFWSKEFIKMEDIKSDLRFKIDQTFRENGVQIPFPQRDVWIKQTGPKSTNGQIKDNISQQSDR